MLNTANFSHYAKCTIVDLVPSTLSTKLLNEMDGDDEDNQSCSDGSSDAEIDMSEEEGDREFVDMSSVRLLLLFALILMSRIDTFNLNY